MSESIARGPGQHLAGSDAAGVTASFKAARAELLARPGGPSASTRRALVALTDDWLISLWRLAGGAESGSALIAVGGHGRGELAPGSDLDLLLLHKGGNAAELAERIWYPIWDAGMKLDHSTRTMAEARRLASQDLRVVLGILDARVVAGDEAAGVALKSSVLADWRALAPKRLDELKYSVDERSERHGELAHLLEPDLKEAYGGLRDLTVLRAIAASWVTDVAHQQLAEARSTLLDVRDALHLSANRSTDRLSAQEQPAVAELLGLESSDALLRKVLSAGRSIAVESDDVWHRALRATPPRPKLGLRRITPRQADRLPLAEGVVLHNGQAVLAAEAKPDRDPVLVLRAAAAAAQAGVRLAPHAVSRLSAESAPMPVPWPDEARECLVSLLGAGRNAVPVWEALDQAGAISRIIPDWEPIRSAPQHNPVHRFTVDRHLLEAAVEASALTRRVRRPDLLLVAALFHDIGKGREEDHTEVGVRLMKGIAPSLGYDEHDAQVLIRLVQHHLLLPETATRRDLDDPMTISTVADAVEDSGFLELLAALTEADAIAAGPVAWTSWKKSLIKDLVSRVGASLEGLPLPAQPRLTPEQAALAQSEGIEVLVDTTSGPVTTLTIAAPDRVGLLGLVAGVLAVNRLQVRSAVTETIGERAVEVWHVQPVFGDVPPRERLREDLRRALEGRMNIAERIAAREAAYARSDRPVAPAPIIEFVEGASERASVLEVRAHDQQGLLYKVGSAIAACGASISAARVSTLGSEVIDVFYLDDGEGRMLHAVHQGRVIDAVAAALREDAPAEADGAAS